MNESATVPHFLPERTIETGSQLDSHIILPNKFNTSMIVQTMYIFNLACFNRNTIAIEP